MTIKYAATSLAVLLALGACEQKADQQTAAKTEATTAASGTETVKQDENAKIESFFETSFKQGLEFSPLTAMRLGIPGYEERWGDFSQEAGEKEHAYRKGLLKQLQAFDIDKLSDTNKTNYRLFEMVTKRDIDLYKWRDHGYPVNQMFGVHAFIPTVFMNMHRIKTVSDAEAYITKISKVEALMDDVVVQLQLQAEKGVIPPKFVFPMVIGSTENILKGAPFSDTGSDSGSDNVILADFKRKLSAAELPEGTDQQALIDRATQELAGPFQRGYQTLLAELKAQQKVATTDDGVWKLPDGKAYYNDQLKLHTSTDLTADEVHQIGLDNVARIQDEMKVIMKKVGFEGDLAAFFDFTRTDERFYYPNTKEGKAAYLKEATAIIDGMMEKAPDYFDLMPKAKLEVRAVEPFREAAAGKAFYSAPSLDGSRPGIYYANLYDMMAMPKYQMEALAFHEGAPGHHFQIAIAQELPAMPMFRRMTRFTSYTEGWGLYTEELGKDMGFYTDPYSDFGRLAMELWRACRLVVDTGIHAKKWTREQAIDYLLTNTPNPKGDVVKAIERYIVMPGQATAYMIGKIKIMELRAKAMQELGDQFDWKGFHRAVIGKGVVPLSMLEENVNAWIAAEKQ